MTPAEFRIARKTLGLSGPALARLLGIANVRTLRRWEAGDNDIPGPVVVLLTALMADGGVRRYFGLPYAGSR